SASANRIPLPYVSECPLCPKSARVGGSYLSSKSLVSLLCNKSAASSPYNLAVAKIRRTIAHFALDRFVPCKLTFSISSQIFSSHLYTLARCRHLQVGIAKSK